MFLESYKWKSAHPVGGVKRIEVFKLIFLFSLYACLIGNDPRSSECCVINQDWKIIFTGLRYLILSLLNCNGFGLYFVIASQIVQVAWPI